MVSAESYTDILVIAGLCVIAAVFLLFMMGVSGDIDLIKNRSFEELPGYTTGDVPKLLTYPFLIPNE